MNIYEFMNEIVRNQEAWNLLPPAAIDKMSTYLGDSATDQSGEVADYVYEKTDSVYLAIRFADELMADLDAMRAAKDAFKDFQAFANTLDDAVDEIKERQAEEEGIDVDEVDLDTIDDIYVDLMDHLLRQRQFDPDGSIEASEIVQRDGLLDIGEIERTVNNMDGIRQSFEKIAKSIGEGEIFNLGEYMANYMEQYEKFNISKNPKGEFIKFLYRL